jgi:tRNA (guanine-N7-)-methyltransferase
MPYAVSSKYEDRWKKMNKNIYDIYMINHEISPELKEKFDFSFNNKLRNLDFKPKIYKNFVIHIEKVFKINEKEELIRLTLGNFNRPEHVYILNKEKPEYYKMPAPIKDNYLAHLELKRLFNG